MHHLRESFRSIFLFSSVVYVQYTPSSKRNLSSKILHKSLPTYYFMLTKVNYSESRTHLTDARKLSFETVLLMKSGLLTLIILLMANSSAEPSSLYEDDVQ